MSGRTDVESRVEECPECAPYMQEYCDRHMGMIVELPEKDRKWLIDEGQLEEIS